MNLSALMVTNTGSQSTWLNHWSESSTIYSLIRKILSL